MHKIIALILFIGLISIKLQSAEVIYIDGSSTVYPISAAMSQYIKEIHPGIKVDVKFSGTSSGFRKLVAGEIPISGASRAIKPAELKKAALRGIEVIEIPVAYDGITVVVNKGNSFLKEITVEELKRLWEPNSSIKRWSQLRPSWPDQAVALFEPGKDSGTFEYFTKAIVGKAHASRTDVGTSEDDGELVESVVINDMSMAYFGWAYYLENKDMLKSVPIANGDKKPVAPTRESILDGSYSPLSRPIYIYVNKKELNKEHIRKFIEVYINGAKHVVGQVGYVPLPDSIYAQALKNVRAKKTGPVFSNRSSIETKNEPNNSEKEQPKQVPIKDEDRSSNTLTKLEFERAVNDLRDACLKLSQQSLSSRSTLKELTELTNDIQHRLSQLKSTYGEACSLSGN